MLETSARLLRLLSLLTSRRSWTGAELAEKLEVTERTLRRDIDKLRSLDYPIRSTSGVAGGYHLGAGTALPPLLLEADEALAVAIGLRSAATGAVVGAEEAAVRALSKLEQVLPARIRRKVTALTSATSALYVGEARVNADDLSNLAGACRDFEVVTFAYEGRGKPATQRRVEPHGLVSSDSRWYLAAWDSSRDDFRTFRVDRLSRLKTTGTRFRARKLPRGSAAAYVAHSVRGAPNIVQAKVLLHAPYAELSRRMFSWMGRLQRHNSTHTLLELESRTLHSLALAVALLDCDFEVLSPPELKAELRRIAQRLTRASKTVRVP